MKTFLLFWTTVANYANQPTRVQAPDWYSALKSHVYSAAKEVRFLVFEVGGDMVWNGTMPGYGKSMGNVLLSGEFDIHCQTALRSEDDIRWLFDTHLKDIEIPHFIPAESKRLPRNEPLSRIVKSAYLVGNEDCPSEIWLSTSENPDLRHDLMFCAYRAADIPAEQESPAEAKA